MLSAVARSRKVTFIVGLISVRASALHLPRGARGVLDGWCAVRARATRSARHRWERVALKRGQMEAANREQIIS